MAKPKKQVSFEDALWGACDKLRGTVEPAEYKHVVLSLIFLKVELKAVTALVKAQKAQVINYLKAADKEFGLLVNFGCNSLKWERVSKF